MPILILILFISGYGPFVFCDPSLPRLPEPRVPEMQRLLKPEPPQLHNPYAGNQFVARTQFRSLANCEDGNFLYLLVPERALSVVDLG